MKINTTMIEIDYENYIDDGLPHNKAISKIAKEWGMSQEEVSNIINPLLVKMRDIDHTGDLGDII